MLYIYVENVTNRIDYIFNFIFGEILKTEIEITSDFTSFLNYNGPKFSYGNVPLKEGQLHFEACGLLFEKDIQQQQIRLSEWYDMKIFFQVQDGALPFDLFAASFYLISRYEEYTPQQLDKHDRYLASDSIAYKGKFLDQPIVHLWCKELKHILVQYFPSLVFGESSYTFTPTIDIDNAYAYKYKGWQRTLGAWLLLLVTFEFKRLMKRVKAVTGITPDPYDSYDKQETIHRKYNLKPYYFVLLGDYGPYDKNLSPSSREYKKLIRLLEKSAPVGIHPSYGSFGKYSSMAKEKTRLEGILSKPVTFSRQHYIRLKFPDTYKLLLAAGITEDFSMGYPECAGFRAGVCIPFYFYDLSSEEKTSLLVHPFFIMDTSLKKYHKLRSKEVLPFVKHYVDQVKNVGGDFVFIFHNESIAGTKMWKNWGDMYEKVIKLAMNQKNVLKVKA